MRQLLAQYLQAEEISSALIDAHQLGLHPPGSDLCHTCMESIKQVVHLKIAFMEASKVGLNELPPVPAGYYIVPCPDPEGPCIGWHCYQHDVIDDPLGGTGRPTAAGYCDGSAPLTIDWVMGRLKPIE